VDGGELLPGAQGGVRPCPHRDTTGIDGVTHKPDTIIVTHIMARNKRQDKDVYSNYSLRSVGPGADPGVQAVSPQVT